MGTVLMGIVVLAAGCDQGPTRAGQEEGTSPVVRDLLVRPDTVTATGADSTTTAVVDVGARVADPDGTVERVVFTVEPATNPRATISGRLPDLGNQQYGRRLQLSLPALNEVYSVRVFAVDNDSLTSNQGIGQFQVVLD